MKATHPLWSLPFLLWVGLWGVSVHLYPVLPEKIPTHFGVSGRPDSWGSPTDWFAVPILLSFPVFLGFIFTRLAFENRSFVNLPNKAEFLLLSPEAQGRVIRRLDGQLAIIMALLLGQALYTQWQTYKIALAQASQLGIGSNLLMLAIFPFTAWMLWSSFHAVRRERVLAK
jgi:hypothetical protein